MKLFKKWSWSSFLVELLYLAVAVTTFSHTAWSASLVFEGSPSDGTSHYGTSEWHIPGMLMALSIDIGMYAVAFMLKNARTKFKVTSLASTFIVLCVSSFLFQLLYALEHSAAFEFGAGVTLEWQERLQPIVDARIVIIPAILPVIATLYTIANIGNEKEHQAPRVEVDGDKFTFDGQELVIAQASNAITLPPQVLEQVELIGDNQFKCSCGFGVGKLYKTEASRARAIKSHFTKEHKELVTWH